MAVALIGVFGLPACASSHNAAAPEASRRNVTAELHHGPLTDYVPAAGLRWMIAAEPARLDQNPELRRALRRLFPDDRVAIFAQATGIHLERCAAALVAQFDYSTLYLVRTNGRNEPVEERFTERLISNPVRVSVHPGITRVSGVIGQTPETLVRVHDDFVAFAVGDPGPGRIVELFALGALRRSPTALRGAALSTVPRDFEDAPLRGYASGPFTGEWVRGVRGLLAGATALAGSVNSEGSSIHVHLLLAGDYDEDAVPSLREAWQDLSGSDLGRLLGLDQPERGPSVTTTSSGLELEVTLDLSPLANGLYSAVGANILEMMNVSLPTGGAPRAPGN